ncbi:helix-turn-helix domain-containing protein [Bradyrhizobium sp. CER78]|uniref:AraC family transcriptional regulator n=1 Tax=Bradyrhizobium sp. CER78 TaxID=3039162 RepID=UPI00244B1531|nr:helix-turn-helix domain-containing protein [Bradyrhizobium sp. CER78]MDH2379875.1 helix-turn-helix domain-containing protein [Bradyrhizobium sp. CER78]
MSLGHIATVKIRKSTKGFKGTSIKGTSIKGIDISRIQPRSLPHCARWWPIAVLFFGERGMFWSRALCFTDPLACQPAFPYSDIEVLPTTTSTRGRRHDAVIARFKAFLEANPDRPLYLAEICGAIGVSERTLRASCKEHLGMGPIRFLTLRRMHLVRRALLSALPSTSTVTRIATDHGFWELGRFAVNYRAAFGESPSETLKHPKNQITIQLFCP